MKAVMRTRSPARILSEADVAIRPNAEVMATAVLRALLVTSGDGILVTDLEHRSLACNGKFAQFFEVPAEKAVRMGVEELRERVYPRLRDREAWRQGLDQVYAYPRETYEDEIELLGEPPLWLRRNSPFIIPCGTSAVSQYLSVKPSQPPTLSKVSALPSSRSFQLTS